MTVSPAPSAAPARRRGPVLGTTARYWVLIAPALVLMCAFYLFPILRVLWMSVSVPDLGLGNYEALATSASIQRMLWTTARICIVTTALTLLLGYVVSYVLTHSGPVAQRIMFLGVLIPLWISALVRAFAWFVLLRREGVINKGLQAMGAIDRPLDLIWNELGVVIGMVHYMLPLGILPIYNNMRNIDARCIAAARGLGATRRTAFLKVFLPLSMPGVVGSGMLVFIYSLGFYVTPALLGGGRVMMISEYIRTQIEQLVRWGTGAMLATTMLIVVALLLAVISRLIDLRRLFGGH